MKGIFSVLVENKDGVLSQIAGLFARRGFNIDSLAVGETDKHDVSSMTMYTYDNWCKVVEGKDYSTTPYFSVHGGDNVYEVYVSGSPKASTGTSSSTADSSNPKTGDMIGVSLALMMSTGGAALMLGKKRK